MNFPKPWGEMTRDDWKAYSAPRPERNREITRRRMAGETLRELAIDYGITITRVQQIFYKWKDRL